MRISQLSTFFLLPVLQLAAGIVVRRALADEGHVAVVADLFEDDVLADIVFGLHQPTKQFAVEARYEPQRSPVKFSCDVRCLCWRYPLMSWFAIILHVPQTSLLTVSRSLAGNV